jgi:hypothetical protein
MNDQEKVRRARVRAVLKAHVWGLLVALGDAGAGLTRPLAAQASDGTHRAQLVLAAEGDEGWAGPTPGGGILLLSPDEAGIVNALGAEGSMNRKRLASLSGHRYGPTFKCLVRQLLARRVLEPDPAQKGNLRWSAGYRATRSGAKGNPG